MRVGELKKMLDDAHDDYAEIVVKNHNAAEKIDAHIVRARLEYIFNNLVQEEYTPENGEPYTYTKAEYDERVVLVI